MKQLKFTTALFLIFAASFTSNAQFNINGEFRTRGIIDNGYSEPVLKNTTPDFSIDQRTRLNVSHQ